MQAVVERNPEESAGAKAVVEQLLWDIVEALAVVVIFQSSAVQQPVAHDLELMCCVPAFAFEERMAQGNGMGCRD